MSHGKTYDLMLSRDSHLILPQKMPFFVRQKVKNFIKNFGTNPEFYQFHQILSKINS